MLQVLPGVEADAARSIAIETDAFGPGPVNSILYPGPFPPNDDTRLHTMKKQLQSDPACKWAKVVDPDLTEEKTIAFSVWYFWQTPRDGNSIPFHQYGPGSNPGACELFFGGMRQRRDELMEGKPYAYLKLLHTDPKHQRRGAASMLIKWGLAEADRLGLPSFLESSPAGRPLYEKYGFRTIATLKVDLSPWGGPANVEIPLMLRPAGGSETAPKVDG